MSENESTSIEQPTEVPLAPMLAKFRSDLQGSRKKLLKDKGNGGKPVFADPEQLRQFVAQFLYPQMVQIIEIFGPALNDTYALAASNAEDIHRLRRTVNDYIGDDEGDDGGASMETVQAIVAAMHALGALLTKKLPEDQEVMKAYGAVSQQIDILLEEMTTYEDEDDDYEDDEDDEDEDEDGDEDEEPEEGAASEAAETEASAADKKPDGTPSV